MLGVRADPRPLNGSSMYFQTNSNPADGRVRHFLAPIACTVTSNLMASAGLRTRGILAWTAGIVGCEQEFSETRRLLEQLIRRLPYHPEPRMNAQTASMNVNKSARLVRTTKDNERENASARCMMHCWPACSV